MAKKRKNSNYVTAKTVAAREAAALAEKKKKTTMIIIAATLAAVIIASVALGVVLYLNHVERENEKKGIGTDMTVTHNVTIDVLGYGEITLELYGKEAPITVNNFVKLAEEGFYDGLTFHRIMSGFMIQGGDPLGNGTGDSGTDIYGEFLQNGFHNAIKHERGTISMARGDDYNSASCQFFIVHQTSANNTASLDDKYAAFGKVTSGMEVVDLICSSVEQGYNGSVDKADQPTILSITVEAVE